MQLIFPMRTVGAAVTHQVDRDALAGCAAKLADLAVCRHLTAQPIALQHLSEWTGANLQQATSTAHCRVENIYYTPTLTHNNLHTLTVKLKSIFLLSNNSYET